jgi:hypothetical protein
MNAMTCRPWTLARHGRLLADRHNQLHQMPAPEWLPSSTVVASGSSTSTCIRSTSS